MGNKRKILVSDQSGKSNVIYKAKELGIDLEGYGDVAKEVVELVKEKENQGYEFEGADGSFELLIKESMNERKKFFDLINFRMIIETSKDKLVSEVSVKMDIKGKIEHTVAEGDGPVNALDAAIRKALIAYYPQIKDIELIDYKVRVLNGKDGTAARVRVLIETMDKKSQEKWGTVGVSENIINASWEALIESFEYYLQKRG